MMMNGSGMMPPPNMFGQQMHMHHQNQPQHQHFGGMPTGFPIGNPGIGMGGGDFNLMNPHQQAMFKASQNNIGNNMNNNNSNSYTKALEKVYQSKQKVRYDDVDIMYRKRGRPLGSKNATTKDSFKNVPKGKRSKRVSKVGNKSDNDLSAIINNGVVARGGGGGKDSNNNSNGGATKKKVAEKGAKKSLSGGGGVKTSSDAPNGDDLQEYYDVLTSLKNSIAT